MGDAIRIAILALLFALGCSDDPTPGPGELATPCAADADCKSLLCVARQGEPKLCSIGCTDPLGDECPSGFRCRRPEDHDGLACVCTDPNGCALRDPSDETCTRASECDDRIDCTTDSCDGARCLHRLAPEACGPGESCRLSEGGCTLGEPCEQDAECQASMDACTGFAQCDALTGRCKYGVTDDDADGFYPRSCGGQDCDDSAASTSPASVEHCNLQDDDCDGVIDEEASGADCGAGTCISGTCVGCGPEQEDCSPLRDGTLCVDLDADAENCGACGRTCEAGFACFDGVCSERDRCADGVSCPVHSTCVNVPGSVECRCDLGFEPDSTSRACTDIDECDRGLDDCGASAICANDTGGFECLCDDGFRLDAGRECVDINECNEGFDCGTGTCVNLPGGVDCSCDFGSALDPGSGRCVIVDACQAGTLPPFGWCDGACRNLSSDKDYCGTCDIACPGAGICVAGECGCSSATLTLCGGSCVNTHTSTTHCGGCDNPCVIGASCADDMCKCPTGQVECSDSCQTLGTTASCKECDDTCPQGASCTASGCMCPVGVPDVCDGRCVDTNSDNENCGECGTLCDVGIGMTCNDGDCRCPPQAPNRCGNACKNFQNDEEHCGGCNAPCTTGTCVNGECTNG